MSDIIDRATTALEDFKVALKASDDALSVPVALKFNALIGMYVEMAKEVQRLRGEVQ